MDIKESFLILPIPQIELSKLHTIRSVSKDSNKYILSQFSQSKIKEQFRQVKRIKGFEARQKDLYNSTSEDLPKVSILSHNIKENCNFRVLNLRKLTYIWQSFLGTKQLSFLAQITNKKKTNNCSQTDTSPQFGSYFEISDHYFKILPKILEQLVQYKLQLKSLSISYVSSISWEYINQDFSFFTKINNELKKFYTLQKIFIRNIRKDEVLLNSLKTILSRNKNIQEISITFQRLLKNQSSTFSQAIQNVNPNIPFLDFFDSGRVSLSKSFQGFQILHLTLDIDLQDHFENGSLQKIERFRELKSFNFTGNRGYKVTRVNFNNLISLFNLIISLEKLENFSLNLKSNLKMDDNFPELGSLLGKCKKLKYFEMELQEKSVLGQDVVSFISNALGKSQTINTINLEFIKSLSPNDKEYLDLNCLTIKEDIYFLTLRKLVLSIDPTIKDSQNILNLKNLLGRTINLENLDLNLRRVEFEDDELGLFSTCFETLTKLTKLELIIAHCRISKVSEIANLWDNINKCLQISQLVFVVYRKTQECNQPIEKFSKLVQNKNDNLLNLDLNFDCQLLSEAEPHKIVKTCSQSYKNLQKFSIRFINCKFTPDQAVKIGQYVSKFKKLTTLELYLTRCELKDQEFWELMKGINQLSKLQTLELILSQNNIEFLSINDFLIQCCQLEFLKINLRKNLIQQDAATKFCNKIRNMNQLKVFQLYLDEGINEEILHEILSNIWKKSIFVNHSENL